MVRYSSALRRLGSPALLTLLSLPVLAATVPGEGFEVAERIASVVADAPQLSELSFDDTEDASRPAELQAATLVGGKAAKTTTEVGKATTTEEAKKTTTTEEAKKTTTTEEAKQTTTKAAKTTTEDPEAERTTTEEPEIHGPKGTMHGAYAFLLALVPFIVAVYVRMTDSGIVLVARRQPPVDPLEATLLNNDIVLVASIEHDICYDLDAPTPEKVKVSAGGLGKVAGQLQRIHPTDLISVHPVGGWEEKNGEWKRVEYGFERWSEKEARKVGWKQDPPIKLRVEGTEQTVQVWRKTVLPKTDAETQQLDPSMPQVTYMMLEHPWFRERRAIYLDQPGSIATLRFFSLWNQAVGSLIARENPMVYQCPDYHTALAPWYALRACGQSREPPRVAVILHNAEYQGAISSQQLNASQVARLASVLDFPVSLVKSHMMIEGGFNMLQAAMEYVRITQGGYGVCAVSNTYAEESKVKHRVLWPLPEVVGLDNPMLENERPKNPYAPDDPPELSQRRRNAKQKLYAHKDFKQEDAGGEGAKGFGYLENNPDARIFVFLGRWVKQKGMDYIADIAEWMVSTHPNAQLAIMGPPFDSFGTYTSLKLQRLATDDRYRGRLKILPEFYIIDQVDPDVKFAFDFCFMPSRDEPFGYVDIEFGWFGALTVGAITGGLGKVPGVYYIPSNVNSASHMCHLLKGCVNRAMALTNDQLTAISKIATEYTFPVDRWQADLLRLYQKAKNEGDAIGTNTEYLNRNSAIRSFFAQERVVPANPQAPRRAAHRGSFGVRVGSLEAAPEPFSLMQMEAQEHQIGAAATLRSSFGAVGSDAENPNPGGGSFIRREVDDGDIANSVEQLVRGGADLPAQDVLALTQWDAMRDGEYREDRGLSLRQPFCGLLNSCTKYLTSWLAGSCFGLKFIDLFIALHYLTAPLLQAFCVANLPKPELNKWPLLLGALVLPFAIVFWTKMSMSVQPNRLMALAVVCRIPLLFLTTIATSLHQSLDTKMARTGLFALLNFLAGADQLFVYYNFMGAAIGDTSKLALRMGMCTGIMGATSYLGQVAINHAIANFPTQFGGSHPLSFLGLLFDVFITIIYICAPAPYREFCLPEWDFRAMLNHRKTLKFIAANIILGAITDPSISGSACVMWRTYLPPFDKHDVFGANAKSVYEWLLPLLLAGAVIVWSYFLYRLPNSAAAIVKAFAFLLVPPAFLRSILAFFLQNNDDNVTTFDVLLILSLVLDVIRSTCIYIALLSVVGSRWRFISFTTAVLFFRQLLAFFVKSIITAVEDVPDYSSWDFAQRWMPVLAFASLLQWACSWGGFLCFDRESSALLTNAKKKIASDNAELLDPRGLDDYLFPMAAH